MLRKLFCDVAGKADGDHHSNRPPTIESLEARTFFSASHLVDLHLGTFPLRQHHKAAHQSAKPHTVAAAKKSTDLNYVGTWSGTYTINGRDGTKPVGVTFIKQKGVAVTGRFNLSGMVGASDVLTTVTIDKSRKFLALINVGKATVSFSGSVTEHAEFLYGRFSIRAASGGWTTGVFRMDRQDA